MREGTRQEETKSRREVSARAANGRRSQSKIAAQESPKGAAGLCSTRPAFEHAIWQREVRLKGASRGQATRSALSPTYEKEAF